MYKYAKDKGWTIQITSGYRSTAEQKRLYDKWIEDKNAGRKTVPVVAEPGTSRHEFGCAVDFYVNGGEGPEQKELGEYAVRELGLRWGQNWSKDQEAWHFDLDPSTTPSS